MLNEFIKILKKNGYSNITVTKEHELNNLLISNYKNKGNIISCLIIQDHYVTVYNNYTD